MFSLTGSGEKYYPITIANAVGVQKTGSTLVRLSKYLADLSDDVSSRIPKVTGAEGKLAVFTDTGALTPGESIADIKNDLIGLSTEAASSSTSDTIWGAKRYADALYNSMLGTTDDKAVTSITGQGTSSEKISLSEFPANMHKAVDWTNQVNNSLSSRIGVLETTLIGTGGTGGTVDTRIAAAVNALDSAVRYNSGTDVLEITHNGTVYGTQTVAASSDGKAHYAVLQSLDITDGKIESFGTVSVDAAGTAATLVTKAKSDILGKDAAAVSFTPVNTATAQKYDATVKGTQDYVTGVYNALIGTAADIPSGYESISKNVQYIQQIQLALGTALDSTHQKTYSVDELITKALEGLDSATMAATDKITSGPLVIPTSTTGVNGVSYAISGIRMDDGKMTSVTTQTADPAGAAKSVLGTANDPVWVKGDTASTPTLYGIKKYAESVDVKTATNADAIQALQTKVGTTTVSSQITAAIQALDSSYTATGTDATDTEAIPVLIGIQLTDGKIDTTSGNTATKSAFVEKAGSVVKATANLIGAATDAETANTIWGAKRYAEVYTNTAVSQLTGALVYKGLVYPESTTVDATHIHLPVSGEGTVTLNGEGTVNDKTLKIGYTYIAAADSGDSSYDGIKNIEKGDYFIWNGSAWDVINGENQVENLTANLVPSSNPATNSAVTTIAVVDGTKLDVTVGHDPTKAGYLAVGDTTEYLDVTALFATADTQTVTTP